MKKFFTFLILQVIFLAPAAWAEIIKMPHNEKTCEITDGTTDAVRNQIAYQTGAPKSSLRFEGTLNRASGCYLMYSTPVGVFECLGGEFRSDDGGKSAFITLLGSCNKR